MPPHQPAIPPPLLPVHHLPSASSFYASLLQPLGIVYLNSSPNPAYPSPPQLHFGYLTPSSAGPRPLIVFTLTQALPHAPARRQHIILPAQSALQVRDVWHKAEILLPGSPGNRIERVDTEGERCMTRDFDGNIVETIFTPPYPEVQYTPPPPKRSSREAEPVLDLPPAPNMNGDKEARRVLEWQSEVARSISAEDLIAQVAELPIRCHVPRSEAPYRERERDELVGPGTFRRADTFPLERERGGPGRGERERLVRRETVTTEHYAHPSPRGSEVQERRSSAGGGAGGIGISTKAVVGTLLGAAAGAAFAYAMVRSESPPLSAETSRRVYKEGSHYTHIATSPRGIAMLDHEAGRVDVMPARSYVSERSGEGRGEREVRPRYIAYHVSMPPQAPSSRAHQQIEGGSSRRNSSHTRPLTILPPKEPSVVYSTTSTSRPPKSQSRTRSPSRSHVSRRSGSGSSDERERERARSPPRSHTQQRSPSRTPRSPSREPSASYASARTHQGPSQSRSNSRAQSVISQSASSTASGSTVKAERELLAKVPTPPSAVGERSVQSHSRSQRSSTKPHTSSKLYRENEPRERYRDRDAEMSSYSHSPRESHHSGKERERERESHHGSPRESHLSGRESHHISSSPRESHHSGGRESHHSGGRERRSTVSNSYDRAREVPLPRSMVSGFGYAESVAPSDSVSSVGSKRERERLRDRMGDRLGRERMGGVVGGW